MALEPVRWLSGLGTEISKLRAQTLNICNTGRVGFVFLDPESCGGLNKKSGEAHDGRSPDYDDWTLNGDILFWNPVLDRAFELSSMGIRVDKESLLKQLEIRECLDRSDFSFHKMILEDELPLTVGGGIGQSRICMYFLNKAHIGEVQAALWPQEMIDKCTEHGIELL